MSITKICATNPGWNFALDCISRDLYYHDYCSKVHQLRINGHLPLLDYLEYAFLGELFSTEIELTCKGELDNEDIDFGDADSNTGSLCDFRPCEPDD
jgi:hypothetical protein